MAQHKQTIGTAKINLVKDAETGKCYYEASIYTDEHTLASVEISVSTRAWQSRLTELELIQELVAHLTTFKPVYYKQFDAGEEYET